MMQPGWYPGPTITLKHGPLQKGTKAKIQAMVIKFLGSTEWIKKKR
jgi:hypothetical protein